MKSSVSPFALPGQRGGLQRAQRRRADREHAPAAQAARRSVRNTRSAPVCMRCSSTSSTRTGWKVPAPTCRVSRAIRAPLASTRCEHLAGRNAGRRSAPRPRPALRVDGLVALGVPGLRRVADVGRQRHRAVALEQRARRPRRSAPGRARLRGLGPRLEHPSPTTSSEPAGGGWLARISASASRAPSDALDEQLDLAAARLAAGEPRLDDARVVQHEHVALVDQARQVGELQVLEGAARSRPGAAGGSPCAALRDAAR